MVGSMLWQLCQKNDSAGRLLVKGREKLMGRLEVIPFSWPVLDLSWEKQYHG